MEIKLKMRQGSLVVHSPNIVNKEQPIESDADTSSAKAAKRTTGRLMTLRQAAAYSGLSYWLLRDYCLDGILPIVRLPGSRLKGQNGGVSCHSTEHTIRKIMVDREDIDRLIQKCKG